MTNEELVALIQGGERDRLLELWQQNRGLCYLKAQRVRGALAAVGRCDVELDDLMQSGYLALVNAVEQYDPEAGFRFSTIYTTQLKVSFAEATGYRSKRQQREPLHTAGSLDTPLGDDPEGGTLGDMIADPVDQYEAADKRLYREWLRNLLDRELEKLPREQGEVVRLRYYQNKTLAEVGAAAGIYPAAARQREAEALRALRRSKEIRKLSPYIEGRTNYYQGGKDPVVSNVLWRETLTEEWEQRHGKNV